MKHRLPSPALITALFSVVIFSGQGRTDEKGPSDGVKACLACHGEDGMETSCENGDTVSIGVDGKAFADSIHGFMTCLECHSDLSPQSHPAGVSCKSSQQLAARASQACLQCHDEEQLGEKAIHKSVIGGHGGLVCSNCHGAHAIMPVAGGKAFKDESEYCMNCHARPLTITLESGEALSLHVDGEELASSIHGKLGCSDCHFGFSMKAHPKKQIEGKRDFALASAEVCRRCHFDKYTKTLDSIHYAMISGGNQSAPVCTDCHGAHGIEKVGKDGSESAGKCRKCHGGIYDVYAESVHGRALIKGKNQDVPVCADCHTAHNIEDPTTPGYHEKIPEICGNCHADAAIMDRYGLSTDVIKTYLQDFHGVTLTFQKMQGTEPRKERRPIAVCVDCHGIHDISATHGPEAKVIKENLLKSCRRCHPDAAADFPDAWISHYEPNFSRAPMVYLVNLFYRIFIPFMIIGLAIQILLHVWRYTVNR